VASRWPVQAAGFDGAIDRAAEFSRVTLAGLELVWFEEHDQACLSTGDDAGGAAVAHGGYVVVSLIEMDQLEGHRKRGHIGVERAATLEQPVGDVTVRSGLGPTACRAGRPAHGQLSRERRVVSWRRWWS
jgi:hypothetical protein